MTGEADKDSRTKRKRSKLERVDKKVEKKEKPKPKRKPKPKTSFSQEIKQSVVVKIGDDKVKVKRKRKVQKKLPVKKDDESRTQAPVQTIFPVQPTPQQDLRPPMGAIVRTPPAPAPPTAPPPVFTDESINQLVNDEQMKRQRAKLSKQEAERQQVRGLLDDVVEDVFKKVDMREQEKREAEKKRVDAFKSLAVIEEDRDAETFKKLIEPTKAYSLSQLTNEQRKQDARVALTRAEEKIKKRQDKEMKAIQDQQQKERDMLERLERKLSVDDDYKQVSSALEGLQPTPSFQELNKPRLTSDKPLPLSSDRSVSGDFVPQGVATQPRPDLQLQNVPRGRGRPAGIPVSQETIDKRNATRKANQLILKSKLEAERAESERLKKLGREVEAESHDQRADKLQRDMETQIQVEQAEQGTQVPSIEPPPEPLQSQTSSGRLSSGRKERSDKGVPRGELLKTAEQRASEAGFTIASVPRETPPLTAEAKGSLVRGVFTGRGNIVGFKDVQSDEGFQSADEGGAEEPAGTGFV